MVTAPWVGLTCTAMHDEKEREVWVKLGTLLFC